MKKTVFLSLLVLFFIAGLYYGSQDNTYLHKFFIKSKSRFPANEAARAVQDIWKDGELRTATGASHLAKVYSPLARPEADICEFYEGAKFFSLIIASDVAVFDTVDAGNAVKIFAKIDCDARGGSPFFLSSFCKERISFFQEEQTVEKTQFRFQNILDGFPRSWYIESVDVTLRDGLSVLGIKPSQEDVKALGKFTFECSEF